MFEVVGLKVYNKKIDAAHWISKGLDLKDGRLGAKVWLEVVARGVWADGGCCP